MTSSDHTTTEITMTVINLRKQDNTTLVASPASFLGRGRFDDYRSACIAVGARFDGRLRANVAPIAVVADLAAALERLGFRVALEGELRSLVIKEAQLHAATEQAATEDLTALVEGLAARGLTPFPYQLDGIRWLREAPRRLLTDQMGLGKTMQVCCAFPEDAPVVIVSPAVLKRNWAREIQLWRPELTTTVLSGRNALKAWPKPGECMILNYDILGDTLPEDVPPGLVVVFDEIHATKNYRAKRTTRAKLLADAAATVWGLTGTPVLNHPFELWSILGVLGLQREAFGSWANFLRVFRASKDGWGGWDFGTPTAQAVASIKRVALGRRREEVLPDLPRKVHTTLEVSVDRATHRLCDKLLAVLEARGVSLDAVMGMVAATNHED